MAEEQAFNRAAYKGALIVPIVIGRNRMRGNAAGPLVEDDASVEGHSPLRSMRDLLAANSPSQEHSSDPAFISKCVLDLLRLFADAHAQYKRERDGAVGFVYEASFPDGRTMLMAEAPTLRRMGLLN